MSVMNPPTLMSSRMHTNNLFKVDESRKAEPVQREKISIQMNSIHNGDYKEVRGKFYEGIDDSQNPNVNNKIKKNSDNINLDKQSASFDDHIMKVKPNFCWVNLNRLLYSKNCVYFYIFLMLVSIAVFLYSIYGFFAKLNELPIVICEICLIVIIAIDMFVRIYATGCKLFFTKCINWLDVILLVLSAVTIALYLEVKEIGQQLENISFALLIFVRNSSQLLRLIVLLKNQKEVRRNIEEIIHFGSEFGDKNVEIQTQKDQNNKSNAKAIISFMEGSNNSYKNKGKKDVQLQNLTNYQENYI